MIEENETTNLDAQTFFLWSEADTDFQQNDLSVVNGAISEFTQINDTVYSVVVTNMIDGIMSISVSDGSVLDLSGNSNTGTSSYSWTFDSESNHINRMRGWNIVGGSRTLRLIICDSKQAKPRPILMR